MTRGWPVDPEERPNAHQVAQVIVLAARAAGPEERLRKAAQDGDLKKLPSRVRQLAGHALRSLFPLVSTKIVARLVAEHPVNLSPSALTKAEPAFGQKLDQILTQWLKANP